jgi:tripartite-type tricarboxylate transporter receptor subunit TctC
VKAGRLKALGVSSDKRVPILPDVPTVNEEIPGYEVTTWYGVFAPVQLPKPYVTKLNQLLAKIFATPDARQRLNALGAEPVTLSPKEFAASIRRETVKWAKVIKESGAQPE